MWKDHRRKFLLASGALLTAPFVSRAQARMPVVGFLLPQHKPSPEVLTGQIAKSPVLGRLRELGWVEGKTFNAERAFGGPTIEGLSEAAASLVAKKVDVIWAQNSPGAIAAARATKSIPIVFVYASWVVESGLVDSFARPGRNVTGQAWFAEPLALLKPTELLREIVPKARRLASLTVPRDLNMQTVAGGPVDLTSFVNRTNAEYRRLGFERESFPIANESEFEQLLAAIESWGPDCLRVSSTTRTYRFQKQILEFARRHRLADAYEGRDWIEQGGLASSGVVVLPLLRRSADMLDRICAARNRPTFLSSFPLSTR